MKATKRTLDKVQHWAENQEGYENIFKNKIKVNKLLKAIADSIGKKKTANGKYSFTDRDLEKTTIKFSDVLKTKEKRPKIETEKDMFALMKSNRQLFDKMIISGEIPFRLLYHIMTTKNLSVDFEAAVLSHLDCPIDFFIKNCRKITPHTYTQEKMLEESHCMRDPRAIAAVLGVKYTTIEKLAESWNFTTSRIFLTSILKNPNANQKLKDIIYSKTGDESLLPQSAKDIFLF